MSSLSALLNVIVVIKLLVLERVNAIFPSFFFDQGTDNVESESKSVCLSAHSGLRGDIVESCLCKRRAVISNG